MSNKTGIENSSMFHSLAELKWVRAFDHHLVYLDWTEADPGVFQRGGCNESARQMSQGQRNGGGLGGGNV